MKIKLFLTGPSPRGPRPGSPGLGPRPGSPRGLSPGRLPSPRGRSPGSPIGPGGTLFFFLIICYILPT